MPIAIERPDGRLVDALLNAGHPVVPVKPTAIKAWRESLSESCRGVRNRERCHLPACRIEHANGVRLCGPINPDEQQCLDQ